MHDFLYFKVFGKGTTKLIPLISKILGGFGYSRACCSYHDFLDRELFLTRKLQNQVTKLKSLHRKLYGRHHDLVDCYGVSASHSGSFLIQDLSLGM